MADLNRYLMEQLLLEDGEFANYRVISLEGGQPKELKPKRLENLGKINVFVGANNSGKSRLIRGIAKNPNNVYELPEDLRPGGIVTRNLQDLKTYFLNQVIKIRPDYQNNSNYKTIFQTLFQNTTYGGLLLNKNISVSSFKHIRDEVVDFLRERTKYIDRWQQPNINFLCQTFTAALDDVVFHEEALKKSTFLYIPTLRSLRDLGDKELFKKQTIADYDLKNATIFTGQSLYDDVEALLRGTLTERAKLRNFEEWLSETFFENKPIALIPRLRQKTLTIKIGEEMEQPIHNLGDGIQSILILTFELFRHADEHVLAFIEEPELFLHPWLQRVFLEVLAKKFPKHQYFLTTHSNHFLDMTLDVEGVSLFLLEKELDQESTDLEKPAKFKVHPISRDDRKPLEILGVRNSSVLLSNCTLWVEGITDRRYIAHWLDLYNKHEGKSLEGGGSHRVFKEDLHYSFVEYAGACITHYSFLDDAKEADGETERSINVDWLCGRLFLITDQDGAAVGSAKQKRQEALKDKLGEHYHCLEGREIENLVSPDVLMKVLQAYGEDLHEAPDHEKYRGKFLGTYLETFLAGKGGAKRRGKYTASEVASGATVSDKTTFCQYAIEASKTWSDLSSQAQELTKKIYAFIQSQNS